MRAQKEQESREPVVGEESYEPIVDKESGG